MCAQRQKNHFEKRRKGHRNNNHNVYDDHDPGDSNTENIERFYSELMPGKYNTELFGYVYTLGYLTLECLVALKGIDSPMQLIVEVSNWSSFEAAFKKIYGIEWKDASPLLAKAVSQQFSK